MYDAEISKKRAEIKIYSDLIAQLEADNCPFDVSDEVNIEAFHPDCVHAARTLRERYHQIDNARTLRNQLIEEVTNMGRELMGGAGISTGWDINDYGRVSISTNIKQDHFDNDEEVFEFYKLN